ncbi:MAG: DNA cytosine methyltransferase [Acidobacteriota bacterium]|nr:DNA cytosine methyltransferase [Acidobacteriota bacterium]
MRYLSVCSGIEAVSVAWQPLGWQPAMFAEIDPFCCWLLRSRYRASRPIYMPSPHGAPDRKEAKRRAAAIRNVVALPADGDVINAGDFTKIGANDAGAIDLLAGGTPCQSFSIAGKRAGLDDPRGNLTIEFTRLAGRLRPLWVEWENVPGVLSIDDGRTFGAFLGMLVELGYGIAYRVLDAQHFGVPQRRRRVFVVGCAGNWRAAAAVLLERHGLSGYPPPSREAGKDIAPTLSARAHGGGGPGSYFDIDGGLIPGVEDISTETMVVHALSAEGFDASEDGTGRGVPLIPLAISTTHTQSNSSGFSDGIAHTLERGTTQAVAFSAKDYGADASDVAPTLRGMGHDASHANGGGQVAIAYAQNQSGDVLSGEVMQSLGTNANATGRNAANVAITWTGKLNASTDIVDTMQRGGEGGRADGVMTPQMAVRRLTPRECERLQGFPDDYTLVEYRGRLAADGPRYKALGNSMAVPVMRWLGQRIAAVDAILRNGHGTGSVR